MCDRGLVLSGPFRKTLDEEAQGRNVANFPLEVVFIDFNDLLGPTKARSVLKCRLKLWF